MELLCVGVLSLVLVQPLLSVAVIVTLLSAYGGR